MKKFTDYIKESLLDDEKNIVDKNISDYNKVKYYISENTADILKNNNMLDSADFFIDLYDDYKNHKFDELSPGKLINGVEAFLVYIGCSLFIGIKKFYNVNNYEFIKSNWHFPVIKFNKLREWYDANTDLIDKYYNKAKELDLYGRDLLELVHDGIFDVKMFTESLLDNEDNIVNAEFKLTASNFNTVRNNIKNFLLDNGGEYLTEHIDFPQNKLYIDSWDFIRKQKDENVSNIRFYIDYNKIKFCIVIRSIKHEIEFTNNTYIGDNIYNWRLEHPHDNEWTIYIDYDKVKYNLIPFIIKEYNKHSNNKITLESLLDDENNIVNSKSEILDNALNKYCNSDDDDKIQDAYNKIYDYLKCSIKEQLCIPQDNLTKYADYGMDIVILPTSPRGRPDIEVISIFPKSTIKVNGVDYVTPKQIVVYDIAHNYHSIYKSFHKHLSNLLLDTLHNKYFNAYIIDKKYSKDIIDILKKYCK